MNTARKIIITFALAAIGLSGAAQARENGHGYAMHADSNRIEHHAERRASRDRFIDRAGHRYGKRDQAEPEFAAGDGRVDRRQDRQWSRLFQGRHSGELNRGEFRSLKREQKKIGRMERRFSSDGYLSGRERYRLERAQDRASRHIARAKHNDTFRGSSRRHGH